MDYKELLEKYTFLFAIMDQKVVWYGSINLLSYGNAQESMMRIESAGIASELMKRLESPQS